MIRDCRKIAEDIGLAGALAAMTNYEAGIETLAGDLDRAEAVLRDGTAVLRRRGETSTVSTAVALLARVLERKGDLEGALEGTRESEAIAATNDFASQILWRGVRARVLARRGEVDAAVRLARAGTRLAFRTDFLVWHGEAMLDLEAALRTAGNARAAAEARRLSGVGG